MVFSSNLFLYTFFPAVLLAYWIVRPSLRNVCLLLASLLFYAWGEVFYVSVMLFSIVFNYFAAILIDLTRNHKEKAGWVLTFSIGINLALLGGFKYLNFVVDNLNEWRQFLGLIPVSNDPVHLPIGISFFTFQAISYLVDVYKNKNDAQRNPINIFLYISFFPQLIAGPIVRYNDIAKEIQKRLLDPEDIRVGFQRFLIGLSKKVLIANALGAVADSIFSLPADQWSFSLSWLAIICYTFQIYFDFSGYSDMAIGLGRMFGFHFLENFNYPYTARSIREFWQKWHISLSNWFRDYLYIPLGGNKKGFRRQLVNLYIVFFLTGLWHGASWNFVLWGLLHGTFMTLERMGLGRQLERLPRLFQHGYSLGVVIIAWVFFRIENIDQALLFQASLFGFGGSGTGPHISMYMNSLIAITLIAATLGSTSIPRRYYQILEKRIIGGKDELNFPLARHFLASTEGLFLLLLWVITTSELAVSAYNPFIYFRF